MLTFLTFKPLVWHIENANFDWGWKVFYSFDSFLVVIHQIMKMLILVDYIWNIIKSKILLLQA